MIWDFGLVLSDNEMNSFFASLQRFNEKLGKEFNDYFGVTIKDECIIEYWYKNKMKYEQALQIIQLTLEDIKLPATYREQSGFDLIILDGKDY